MTVQSPVNLSTIRKYVGDRSYGLGMEYARNGSVRDCARDGDVLTARCQGTGNSPYRVRIGLSRSGIEDANCTCPVGSGACKHVAAVLIAFCQDPPAFEDVKAAKDALDELSREELLQLLRQMLKREPDLRVLIDTLPRKGKKLTPKAFERQADRVFDSDTGEWGYVSEIADRLLTILDAGRELLRAGDAENASAVYRGVVRSALLHFEPYSHDEEGSLFEVVMGCVEGLGKCLKHVSTPSARMELYRPMLDVLELDHEMGGTGLGDDAYDFLVNKSSAEDKKLLGEIARDEGLDEGLVLDLVGETFSDERFMQACRASGRHKPLIERLLQLGRVEEALKEFGAAPEYERFTLCEAIDAAGRGAALEAYIDAHRKRFADWDTVSWIEQRARERKDKPRLLDVLREQFRMRRDIASYRKVRDLAQELGRWQEVRPALLRDLGKGDAWLADSTLLSIYLEEGLVDEALKLVNRKGALRRVEDLTQVARAAEATKPAESIKLYLRVADGQIRQYSRGSYRAACGVLARVKRVYEQCGRGAEWQACLDAILKENRKRRALQEEIVAAKLLG